MANALILGADSGIGSAIMKLLPGSIGTSRRPNTEYIFLDVATKEYPKFEQKFDLVYYCIAISGFDTSPEDTVNINATQSYQCLDNISQYCNAGATVRVLTSILGSLTKGFVMPAVQANVYYRMSKAALNMGVIELSKKYPNINWQLVHPGFVKHKVINQLSYNDQAVDPVVAAKQIVSLPFIPGISYIEIDISGTRMLI